MLCGLDSVKEFVSLSTLDPGHLGTKCLYYHGLLIFQVSLCTTRLFTVLPYIDTVYILLTYSLMEKKSPFLSINGT